jgi:hypothetical protein
MANLRLAGSGCTDLDVDILHDFGTAVFLDADGF